ncbi:MAG: sugar phosphate isomerase/epimerase [Flexilinea sp.]|nr:sugar phosphate isomerase/epimerase [Flexilinea sp.]
MSRWFDGLSFRLGTSSYIIPDDILPNVRYLADKTKDIELVLFDVDEYCNIPDSAQIAELKEIAAGSGLSYTVHLPLNLNFSDKERDVSITKAMKVISATRALDPLAYVCHLECRDIPDREGEALADWQAQRIRAVNLLSEISGIRSGLAIENLERYPIEWNEPVIRACGTHATLDIGHLFLQKIDPVPVMRKWLPLTSVVHLHGVGTRDHQSLKHMDKAEIRAVLAELKRQDYQGVVTLEIFNENDFTESMEMIRECL